MVSRDHKGDFKRRWILSEPHHFHAIFKVSAARSHPRGRYRSWLQWQMRPLAAPGSHSRHPIRRCKPRAEFAPYMRSERSHCARDAAKVKIQPCPAEGCRILASNGKSGTICKSLPAVVTEPLVFLKRPCDVSALRVAKSAFS